MATSVAVPDVRSAALEAMNPPEPAAEPVAPEQLAEPKAVEPAVSAEPEQSPSEEFKIDWTKPEAEAKPADETKPEDELFKGMTRKEADQYRTAFLRTEGGRQLLSFSKMMRGLEAPPEQGGLGFQPNQEQILEMWNSHQFREGLDYELESGDPRAAGSAFFNLIHDAEDKLRPGADVLIGQIPRVLQRYPEIYAERLATPVLNGYMQAVKERAAAESDPGMRSALLNLYRGLQFDLTGQFDNDEELKNFVKDKTDPLTARSQNLQERERRVMQAETNRIRAEVQTFHSQLEGAIQTNLSEDLDRALESAKELKNLAPKTFNAIKEDLRVAVMDGVAQHPQAAAYNRLIGMAARTLRDSDRVQLANTFREISRGVIDRVFRPYLQEAVEEAKALSDARHEKLSNASSKVGSNGSGAPISRSLVAGLPERKKRESREDYERRALLEVMKGTDAF